VRCPWGDAKITASGRLRKPIRWVIHAVGPIHPASEFWGDKREKWKIDFAPSQVDRLLRSAYDACFKRSAENGIRSIGFPAISCGVFGFPYEGATRIALSSIIAHGANPSLEKVLLVGLEQPAWDAYISVCASLVAQGELREVPVGLPDPTPASTTASLSSGACSSSAPSTSAQVSPTPSTTSVLPASALGTTLDDDDNNADDCDAAVHIHGDAPKPAPMSQSARRRQRKQKQQFAK